MVLKRIEKLNIIIGILLVAVSFIIWQDSKLSLSLALGSVIGGANFWMLVKLVGKIFGDGPSKWRFGLAIVLKFLVLILVLWLVVNRFPVHMIAFLVGLSTIVLAVIISQLFSDSTIAR